MFLARRDLWFAKGRFALVATVVALVAMLMVLLTGLSTGLVTDNVGGIRALPVSHLAFNADAGVKFNRSTVTQDQWERYATQPGVRLAAPIGLSLANGQAYRDPGAAGAAHDEIAGTGKSSTKGTAVDVALVGMQPGSFPVPSPAEGSTIGADPDGVMVSRSLADKGVRLGDTIVLDRTGAELAVVGVTDKANYGHVPMVYLPLARWQQITYGGTDTGADNASRLATVIAVDADPGADLVAADRNVGTVTATKAASFAGSPGYAEETGTLLMIEGFLYVIAAVLVGAFFTVWTIQRRPEIGLVKALGGSNGYLLKDALIQAVIVLVVATAAGLAVGRLLGFMIPGEAPFALEPVPLALAALALIVMGLLGAGLSIRRITKVDPLIALGATR